MRKSKQPKRCKICGKVLRSYNKSGYCNICYNRNQVERQRKFKLKKRVLMGFLFLGFVLMFLGSVASAELTSIDSIKVYDSKTQTITLINKTDLTKNIATIKLNTPLINKVGYGGVFKVAEFEVNSYVDVESALKEIEFYNLNKDMEKIQRTYEYKVKSYQSVVVNDYEEVCSIVAKGDNSSCVNEIVGTHLEQREVWLPLEKIDFLKDDVKTIGIFTYVYKGDKVEWIPTYYGVKINEWASWSASLNSGLIAYWKLDEGATYGNKVIDSLLAHNGTNYGASNVTGKIEFAYHFVNKRINMSGFTENGDYSVVAWVKMYNFNNLNYIFNFNTGFSNGLYTQQTTKGLSFYDGATSLDAPANVYNNTWMLVALTKSGTNYSIYSWAENETGYKTATGNLNDINVNMLELGGRGDTNWYFDGRIDEVGMWNRQLTSSEIVTLFASGEGMSYQALTNPYVLLNAPANFTNFSVSTMTFNYTGVTNNDGGYIDSITLYVDGATQDTNTTNMKNGTTYVVSKALSSGYHNWSVSITDANGTTIVSELRTFNITINSPTISLITPIAYYNTTNSEIDFQANVTDDFKVQNASLYIDGVYNRTNTLTCNAPDYCEYYFNDIVFSEGEHYWSILAYDNDSNPTQSENRYFTIDLTPPVISVTSPPSNNYRFWTNYTDGIYSYFPYSSYFINWTTTDNLGLDTCWFENISLAMVRANFTITCNNNATIVYPVNTQNTLRFYANDTAGNLGSAVRTGIYNDIRIDRSSHSWINYTTEGVSKTFFMNVRKGVGDTLENVNFVFNGVKYAISPTGSNFSKTITIPEVTSTTATTYYWEFDFGEGFFNSTIYNITIGNILLSPVCNGTYPYYVFNVTLRDEKTQKEINGTIETDISIYPYDNSSLILYNWNTNTDTNRTYLCSNLPFNSSDVYKADGTIKYYSDLGTLTNYTAMTEYYTLLNYTLNEDSQFNNITLYDINTSEGTEFQVTFKDASYIRKENILIYVYRQYLPEGIFKVVELPKTDSQGQTLIHLVRNDVVYKLIAVDSSGVVLGTLNNFIAFCEDYTIGNCKIDFQGTTSESALEDTESGITYTLNFDEDTSIISFNFSSTTSQEKSIIMEVTNAGVVTNRTICNTSTTGLTGSLTCDVSSVVNSSSSVNIKIYVNGNLVIMNSYSLDTTSHNTAGLMFFGFLFILAIGLFFIESKEGMIFGIILGFIVLIALGIFKGSILGTGGILTGGILWLIVVGVIILIKLNNDKT